MSQPMQHQMMGYDRAITMFSPDGRLLQVEYAKKTVKQGSTVIGIVYDGGVLLITDKRVLDPLMVSTSVEKIFKIDDHIAGAASGIVSDGRILMDRAMVRAQQNRVTYDAPIDVVSVVRDIADLQQMTTQSGGYRPFGVSLLIAGVDDTPRLFETDPTGIYFEYKATVIGEGETKVKPLLHERYKEGISRDDAIALAIQGLKEVLDKDFSIDRVDAATIPSDSKRFEQVERALLERLAK
ncbi:MAG: archaeal proteasome endopeptidase complex subunit alpha [Candidatus Woesearchaeota archaeon]